MSTIIKAILKINPNAEVSVSGDDINSIVWENGTPPIAKELILAKVAELQAEYKANQYQRDRASEYPSIGDQLDYIYHNGIDAWKTDMVDPIKNKYPKDNS
jgi:hypothetical protein